VSRTHYLLPELSHGQLLQQPGILRGDIISAFLPT
jgi:hypothetical protein